MRDRPGQSGAALRSDPFLDRAAEELEEYLQGERRSFDMPMRQEGTEFQKRVWRAISGIPYGETATYRKISEDSRQEWEKRGLLLLRERKYSLKD